LIASMTGFIVVFKLYIKICSFLRYVYNVIMQEYIYNTGMLKYKLWVY